ncbi:MAG: hypothetical protein U0271_16950 [Polyangiaceae bacterium]
MTVSQRVSAGCILACSVGCGAKVVFEEPSAGGAGGSSSVTTSSSSAGGAAEGGSIAGTVPGCEVLEWAGDPILLNDGPLTGQITMAPLANGDVALVYQIHDAGQARVLSTTLGAPFDAWPPATTPPNRHADNANSFVTVSVRPDGLFTLDGDAQGLYRLGVDGAVGDLPGSGTLWLETTGDGAFWMPTVFDPPMQVFHTENAESPALLDYVGDVFPSGCGRFELCDSPTGVVLSFVSPPYCQNVQGVGTAELFALTAFDPPQSVLQLELPFFPVKSRVLPRPGAYWLGVVGDGTDGARVYPLGGSGELTGDPHIETSVGDDWWPHDVATWRNGYALDYRSQNGVALGVTNGTQKTVAPLLDAELTASDSDAPMLSGGPAERSVLVAFSTLSGVLVARADCVTPL